MQNTEITFSTNYKYWTDQQLLDFEERLYDDERGGGDTWDLRDEVLWELNRRGLCK